MTRANLEKGRSFPYFLTVVEPSPTIGTTTLDGVPRFTSAERGRSLPFTKR
jgi:hypothetical protein